MENNDFVEESVSWERTKPRTDFVRKLGQEIGQAAWKKMGRKPGVPFERAVSDLRYLVRLLRQTLVPVPPRPAFRQILGNQLQAQAVQVMQERRKQWRWLVIGSAVGSLVSLLSVLIAVLLRQRTERTRSISYKGA